MAHPSRATHHAFTAVVCTGCGALSTSVLEGLRKTIGRCPHGVLVRADCILGRFSCAARPAGVMVLIQPCSTDRAPTGSGLWIGPVATADDIRTLRTWLERGDLTARSLPRSLATHARWVQRSRTSN